MKGSIQEEMMKDELTQEKPKKEKLGKRIKQKRKAKKEAYLALEPEQKKKVKRKRIIIGVVIVLAVLFIVPKLFGGNGAMPVATKTVQVADVESQLRTSGTVKSELEKTYFSDIDCKIGKVEAQVGETVKKGQKIITYDENELNLAYSQAELEEVASQKGYESLQVYQNQLATSKGNEKTLKEIIDQQEIYVKQIEDIISDETVKKRADLYDQQYRLQIGINAHNAELATLDPRSDEYENTRDSLLSLEGGLAKISKEITLLQDYKTADDKEGALIAAKKELSNTQALYEETKAKKSAAEGVVQNSAKLEETKANGNMNILKAQDKKTKLEQAKNGVCAEFDGIITEVSVIDGAPVSSTGTQMLKLASSKDVKVEITVSKYDLEQLVVGQKATVTVAGKPYEATVSKINRMAETNESGTPVVTTEIHIDKPDDSIYLGVEAKVVIDTAKATGVLTVPVEAVNADKEGDFCYIIENGIVAKRNVTVGISSDEAIEIKEGLKEGEQVILNLANGVTEGSKVVAMPEQ